MGGRLPPERTLAETLGVNRATVRIALHELEAAGLVTARQGSGYAVRDFKERGGPDLIGPLADVAREDGRLIALAEELLSVRRHLARAVLERLVSAKLPDGALARIEERIEAFEAIASDGASPDACAAADLSVLEGILDALESPVLRLFFNPTISVLARMPELTRAMYEQPSANATGWRAVLMLSAGAIDVGTVVDGLRVQDELVLRRLRERHSTGGAS